MPKKVVIKKAKIAHVRQIHRFINEFAKKETMLPRSLNELYESIREFFIYEENGIIKGVCSIKIVWEDLAEIRSLAVKEEYQGKGIGKALVKRCLNDVKNLGIKRVFALTYQPDFFKKLGFKEIDKSKLPQKIWGDCLKCPKFPECDEYAVILNLY
ncbi:MAG: N-acetyltransferase [Thermodesulfovibrionales bacterium]|nr:N-acetyltransferase [Thermodesulfovibrionales bacterium]